ncbi:TolC family protein [Propionivibrio limicola]|uniref:TolC family protein n=1 Tax=Propionivibrio limicola TaxID=167645 RepID=UPI001290CFF6|nr:TolC family protein [Propionivibrio limicola]
MPFRRAHLSLLPFAVLAVCSFSEAMAFGALDPFHTEALTPPRPLLAPAADKPYVPCQAQPADTVFGVVEVVDLALCRNPQTHEAWANARYQAAQVGVARSDYLPTLDGRAAASRLRTDGDTNNPSSASLTLSWLLYDFGARDANLENARQLLSATSATLDATVQAVFLAALQSYYNAQAARAALIAAQESEKASRESLTAAEVRYRVGTATPADRLQAQTAWSQAVLNRIRVEGVVKTTLGTLANVMGLDANQPLTLAEIPRAAPETTFERDLDALIAEARQRRPDLQAAESQVKAAQASVDYARAVGLPTLSLSGGPGWQDTGAISSHSNAVGLTLTVPFFSGFNTTYNVRSAQARVDVASAQRDSVRLQVALDVWTAYQSLVTATQSFRTAGDLLASAEQSEKVALGRYKAGVGSILDVLNAQSALAAARLQRIQAALDWHVSRATLAKAVGALDSRLLASPARSAETSTP